MYMLHAVEETRHAALIHCGDMNHFPTPGMSLYILFSQSDDMLWQGKLEHGVVSISHHCQCFH